MRELRRRLRLAWPVRSIETPRLILRDWHENDLEGYAAMNADPRVMEFFVAPMTRQRSYEHARMVRRNLRHNRFGCFVIEVKGERGFSGIVGVDEVRYDVPFRPRREILWRLPVHRWGNGYATEAAQALMRFAFEELRWPEIIAMTAAINGRSRRVMEKLGMTHDPADDFAHPMVPDGMAIKPHVLYRRRAEN